MANLKKPAIYACAIFPYVGETLHCTLAYIGQQYVLDSDPRTDVASKTLPRVSEIIRSLGKLPALLEWGVVRRTKVGPLQDIDAVEVIPNGKDAQDAVCEFQAKFVERGHISAGNWIPHITTPAAEEIIKSVYLLKSPYLQLKVVGTGELLYQRNTVLLSNSITQMMEVTPQREQNASQQRETLMEALAWAPDDEDRREILDAFMKSFGEDVLWVPESQTEFKFVGNTATPPLIARIRAKLIREGFSPEMICLHRKGYVYYTPRAVDDLPVDFFADCT